MRQRYTPPDVYPAGEANVGQAMYRSLERSPQDTRDGFDLYSAQASFAGRALTSSHRLLAFLEYISRIRFSSWESFIGFYIWCYPTSTILACLLTFGIRISLKKKCWKGSMAAEMPSCAFYLVHYIVWRVNLSKSSPNFIWTLRTSTTYCRVSFIDLFPANFRIVFLPHTNAGILLEPAYCGTITQPA